MASGSCGLTTPSCESAPGAAGKSAEGICGTDGFNGSTAAARTMVAVKAAGAAGIAGLTKAAPGSTDAVNGDGEAVSVGVGARSPPESPSTGMVSATTGELREPAWPPPVGAF